MVCFGYIIVNILHKGNNKDNNCNNNNNNNNNNNTLACRYCGTQSSKYFITAS